jgi:hypothetical protein
MDGRRSSTSDSDKKIVLLEEKLDLRLRQIDSTIREETWPQTQTKRSSTDKWSRILVSMTMLDLQTQTKRSSTLRLRQVIADTGVYVYARPWDPDKEIVLSDMIRYLCVCMNVYKCIYYSTLDTYGRYYMAPLGRSSYSNTNFVKCTMMHLHRQTLQTSAQGENLVASCIKFQKLAGTRDSCDLFGGNKESYQVFFIIFCIYINRSFHSTRLCVHWTWVHRMISICVVISICVLISTCILMFILISIYLVSARFRPVPQFD